ncbi:DUF4190 domain-containing protein [Agromyces endophyticus]|uniref:DUF4190 domain-containing protein n=1 Tax=Agromyces sp. H17E-10 TaxID=2932244 RepID=UPI001FD3103C|nr:DUF4190 domain-containing protein [Agromyces sp. H17E-10]UOQ87842.1 DUF4190 domain-containing protein [Agromyces sp. H17E-10]
MTSDTNAAAPGEAPQPEASGPLEDAARNMASQPPLIAADGKPAEQKWATGGGRIVALIAGILGVVIAAFVPIVAIALGFLALVLGSTARGHMVPGRPGRGVATAAFVIGIVAVVLGAVSWVLAVVLRMG